MEQVLVEVGEVPDETADEVTVLRLVRDSRPPARCWTAPAPSRFESAGLGDIRAEADDTPTQLVRLPGAAEADPDLPEIRAWAAMLAVGVAQVLGGRRAVGQLERWLSPGVVSSVKGATAVRRRGRAYEPGPGVNAVTRVRSVHVQCVTPRVAEVAVHLATAERSSAMAFRLEGRGRRWLCVALAVETYAPEPVAA